MTTQTQRRIRKKGAPEKREGAAMLIVLMVLLMTSATASFAIHSTTMEMRSAGYARQAMQTSYIAEGAAYSSLAYMDALGAQAVFIQYTRTTVPMGTPYAPGAPVLDRPTRLLRITMDDFTRTTGVQEPPIELDTTTTTPSLGARTAFVPSFQIDGTDMYRTYRQVAGRNQSGHDPMNYVRINMTARGSMAPPSDYQTTGDPRRYHETATYARAMAEMGPFAGGI